MPSEVLLRKPEIMSPAGYWPQLHAAMEAGADSVYFGLKHFTARAKVGFSLEELAEAMRTLHKRGVKGFVTFNTLVFEHELREAARTVAAIAEAGADAIIVQDAGVLKLVHEIAPDLEIHASTQMSITSAEGVRFAQSLGATRVTLARELSLDDLRAIRAATDCELEIFVHGALCVAYSGQCFSSEAWGGRSANRGQCAQACRLPYELIVDEQLKPLGDSRYLLSPGDLFALHQVPEIVQIGIAALKIEGRYKDSDYVALATRAYRKAVDDAWEGRAQSITAIEELQLEQVYSRGLGPHFLTGTNHQTVVEGRAPRHRGVLAGRVVQVSRDGVTLHAAAAARLSPLKPGDGVVFDAADWRSPEEREEGGRVYEVAAKGNGNVELRFGNRAVNFERIRPGDLVWRTHDPDIDKTVKPFIDAVAPVYKQPVHVHVIAREGEPLETEWNLVERPAVRALVRSAVSLGRAMGRGITTDQLREQFGRLGNTAYELVDLDLRIEGQPFAPSSILNQVRRDAVEQLQAQQSAVRRTVAVDPLKVFQAASDAAQARTSEAKLANPQLHLLVRTPEQMEAALRIAPASITLDYLDLYGLKPSVERVKASGIECRVASPRVLKPGEERVVDFLLRLDCPILVRSTALLDQLRGRTDRELAGDFSLNAANSLSAAMLLELGLSRIAPTHDLNAEQVADLARRVGPEHVEAIVYQHLPVFHTEHCVFCRFLSEGTSYKDCGRPCEKHKVSIRDVAGRSHPVMADVGCRNTVFGAEAQEASAHLQGWRNAGIYHFRLEFAHESGEEVAQIAQAFADALARRKTIQQLAQALKQIAPQGTTEGSLFVPKDYLTLPILQ